MSGKKLAQRAALVLLGFLGLATLAVGAFAVWLTSADLKPIVERQASDGLQRRVTIGAFKVGWGDPLAIEFSDLRIANASWGSAPDMVRVGHLSALTDVRSLLRGRAALRKPAHRGCRHRPGARSGRRPAIGNSRAEDWAAALPSCLRTARSFRP